MSDISGIISLDEFKELMKDSPLPNPAEVTYWGLRKQRTYWIDYEIDENYLLVELAKELVRINIEEKDNPSPEPITLYIHSYGGDLRQAIFFCDLIETSHVPIITVATGAAMSAGFLIFISGKRRYAFKHTKLLVHQGSGVIQGNYEEMDAAQKAYKKEVEGMKDYILSHTDIFEKTYDKHKKSDWYLTGEELLTYGVADALVENFSDIK